MINEVVLEGIVVRAWKFADDMLFRLACYRDPDLPQKSRSDLLDLELSTWQPIVVMRTVILVQRVMVVCYNFLLLY